MSRVVITAPDGAPEIERGADLAEIAVRLLRPIDGDLVVVTSKAVAKAEGRAVAADRERVIEAETVRVVATTRGTRIVRNRLGLTLAAAGVDASNVRTGLVVALPLDPDGSARALRRRIRELARVSVGVVVTDTAGRAWRLGQTDICIGAAGIRVLESYAGRVDAYGNALAVTAPAIADEVAGAAELAQGKLTGRPFALVRGLAHHVSAADGPGAGALIRNEAEDLFGFGSREAVIRAFAADAADRDVFGAVADAHELADGLTRAGADDVTVASPRLVCCSGGRDLVHAVAFAHGWEASPRSGSSFELAPPSR